jgi:hypothetical protein
VSPLPRSEEIVRFHDRALATPREPARAESALWAALEANHWHNAQLWGEEDLARRKHAPDSEIAGNKRAIDQHNQKRNDAIERIDEAILASLENIPRKKNARLNSETAGAMIDRLSILALKVKAMRRQTERTDVDREHVETCRARLEILTQQRKDLAGCLDRLLEECERGESYFKVYRQFKMYNDPNLNPAVYNEARRSKRS